MMGKKRWMFFRKLKKESSSSSATPPPSPPPKRWRLFGSAFKWRRLSLQLSFFDDVLFRVVSVLEAVVLVITLAFFYLFCGCHF
ncbi:hypothetical protein TIFTF001_012504 [Ficus carica]|uniref:Transmembrane protein n=1 Tax=Ficus carica TaxID=3494 RepID=A0AA88D3S0_FICCA|nr:hypothetical protein TIFTF001_012504 [Ficus carica]